MSFQVLTKAGHQMMVLVRFLRNQVFECTDFSEFKVIDRFK